MASLTVGCHISTKTNTSMIHCKGNIQQCTVNKTVVKKYYNTGKQNEQSQEQSNETLEARDQSQQRSSNASGINDCGQVVKRDNKENRFQQMNDGCHVSTKRKTSLIDCKGYKQQCTVNKTVVKNDLNQKRKEEMILKRIIQSNYVKIHDTIEAHLLIPFLFQEKAITFEEKVLIQSIKVRRKAAETLLDIILENAIQRLPFVSMCDVFIKSLKLKNYQDLIKTIEATKVEDFDFGEGTDETCLHQNCSQERKRERRRRTIHTN